MQLFRMFARIDVRILIVLLLLVFGAVIYIGASTSPIILFVFSICVVSFFFSIYLTKWVLAKDEGPPEMAQVFLIIISVCVCLACLLYLMYEAFRIRLLLLMDTPVGYMIFSYSSLSWIMYHFKKLFCLSWNNCRCMIIVLQLFFLYKCSWFASIILCGLYMLPNPEVLWLVMFIYSVFFKENVYL